MFLGAEQNQPQKVGMYLRAQVTYDVKISNRILQSFTISHVGR